MAFSINERHVTDDMCPSSQRVGRLYHGVVFVVLVIASRATSSLPMLFQLLWPLWLLITIDVSDHSLHWGRQGPKCWPDCGCTDRGWGVNAGVWSACVAVMLQSPSGDTSSMGLQSRRVVVRLHSVEKVEALLIRLGVGDGGCW
jgi:hypothetical protein